MSESVTFEPKYRLDYQAPAFRIHTTNLTFELDDHATRVTNSMELERLGDDDTLTLDGDDLELAALSLDGVALDAKAYQRTKDKLKIFRVPKRFLLTVVTIIDPARNSSLEGLYKSAGTFCTQCEAEGFRRITYYLDRPDVLSVFTTTIHAPKASYPFLLSNGNCIEKFETGSIQTVTWHDPFPKPAYLFALVAGDFDLLEDSFTTQSGRVVTLQLFVDRGNLPRADFAMAALKRAMAWDEQRFNLEYDLDIYMVVAVDFFNMGAMENKGLNIFNSKYVLADSETATDQDFINVEAVIGHEYFHNWTGNRVTCQDWFQLSLKEGLTVFRDQEFSADMGMRAVKRIQDVRIMRTHQFEEDASPMAHPIRPDKVLEMNNFYTVTVYNKGAEVIRMLHTLLGETGFQKGMKTYIHRHDGQAVTCEDFVRAMEDANDVNLSQFRHWYAYAGTPEVDVDYQFDSTTGSGSLTLQQHTPDTPGQSNKPPMHIPIRLEFVNAHGERIQVVSEHAPVELIELTERRQVVHFSSPEEKVIPALLADFSAPIRLRFEQPEDDLIAILNGAHDAFLRWDASQRIYLNALRNAIRQDDSVELSERFIDVLETAIRNQNTDPALLSLLLQPPSEETLAQEYKVIPIAAATRVVAELKSLLALSLRDALLARYAATDWQQRSFNGNAVAIRMCTNAIAQLLAYHHEDEVILRELDKQFSQSNTMTLAMGALAAAVHAEHPAAERYLAHFADQWGHEKLVMDKWLAVQSSAPGSGTAQKVELLTHHPAFDWGNPNRIYALLATFTHNLNQLHAEDGSGYALIEQAISRLNQQNPQVASRLLSPLLKWRSIPEPQQTQLKRTLERLQTLDNLAPDLHEKLSQALA
ncbi:aminopeptidase N [Aliidiomarina sanyensis]|uniref:Aminopeptidase N n=1 Tax=Aliidiomarina sanyensis TaxID=1249555 RepID=A0A432WRU0_9GAMM|nr:aminopeptidase N [Aliidiomarina sanyensis]RUO36481.1 aminopeptidase N [Aliidiomarina sanyensis]